MAPRMPREYHSAVEPTYSYSLRTTTKRVEDHSPRAHDVDTSKISGKEDFFRSMGLQMKRHQCEYSMFYGDQRTKKINIPNGITLRDCSVVVRGATCQICGKCFKCITDVDLHDALKHKSYPKINGDVANESFGQRANDKTDEVFPELFEHESIPIAKCPATKEQNKLRLTLRIGSEVVARITMKRKHLKMNNTTDMATQTEPTRRVDELIMGKSEGAVPRIDLPVFDNSPCRCCNSGVQVVNSANRYLDGNIVTGKDNCEESTTQKEDSLDSLTELCETSLCETSLSEKDDTVVPGRVSCKSNATQTTEQGHDKSVMSRKGHNRDEFSPLNDRSIISSTCDSDAITESMSVRDKRISTELAVQSPEKDMIRNEKLADVPSENRNSAVVGTVTVPVILPIIAPNSDHPSAKNTEQCTSVASQHESLKSPTPEESAIDRSIKENGDDEVQEVLRIVRGQSISKEINHESPNRNEQEMLLRDAIMDMLRMEEQGWHLLEKESVEPTKKRKRAKPDNKNGTMNEGSAKKRKKAQTNVDVNNKKGSADKCASITKEFSTKTQKSGQNEACISDNVKENLMTCNGNINIPWEVLYRYGINYYNETTEINNNAHLVQDPSSCFLTLCSGGIENRNNKPTVIDLVNDTDE